MDFADLLEKVRIGERTVLDVTGGDKERKLVVELRRLLPEEPRAPKRLESPPRAHVFLAAESLGDYLAGFGGDDLVVFADPASEEIRAILSEKATNGFEQLLMKPATHPLWKPWQDIAGNWLEIEAFSDFVHQNRRSVVEPEGRELAYALSQIRATVSVEIARGRGRKGVASNGLVVTTEIKGQPNQEETVDLPEMIAVQVPLYVQTSPRRVELDLCLRADTDGGVKALLTAGGVAEARVAAFDEMVKVIRGGIGAKGTFTFGRPAHGAWSYLKEIEPKA